MRQTTPAEAGNCRVDAEGSPEAKREWALTSTPTQLRKVPVFPWQTPPRKIDRPLVEFLCTPIDTMVNELSLVVDRSIEQYRIQPLLLCLRMFVYPNGSDVAIPIDKPALDTHDPHDAFIVRQVVGKLPDDLYFVMRELAEMRSLGIDVFHRTHTYVFLNKVLIDRKQRRKPRRL